MPEYRMPDRIFDFIFHMAVDDATKQRAYLGEKKEIEDSEKVKKLVRDYVDSILNDGKSDLEHFAVEINGATKDDFCFGNIQKLLNMSAKYMYITCYADSSLREKFKNCHCPMDNYMIRQVRKEYSQLLDVMKWDRNLLRIPYGNGKSGEDGSRIAWSKISFMKTDNEESREVYDNFQCMISLLAAAKGMSPLEYDYEHWRTDRDDNSE